jgi:glycosyltransferase involved in cell wall biosynthesis
MRILHVIGWLAPRYGGTSEVVLQYYRSLSARGHQVDILTTNIDGAGVLEIATGRPVAFDGVTATFHELARPRRFLTSWSLVADLRDRVESYDVVHIHNLYRFHTLAAASVARRHGVPYVLQVHGSLNPATRARHRRLKDGYHRLIEDRDINGAALVLCTSQAEERAIRELGYSVPTMVVPLGVDVAALRVPADVSGFRARLAIDPRARVITFLGRISHGKGADVPVRGFAEVAASMESVHLVIAGPDDLGIAAGETAAIGNGSVRDRISCIGTIGLAEKRALLQASSALVLPSTGENFGLAVAEAMAVGCPVIVCSGVALQETIALVGAGIVAERNVASIAAALRTVIENPEDAARMGAAGSRIVDDKFTWRISAAGLEAAYASVVASGIGRRPGTSEQRT